MRIFIYLKNLNAENKEYFLVTKRCLTSVDFAGMLCIITIKLGEQLIINLQNKRHIILLIISY